MADLESEILNQMHTRILNNFLDIVLLLELRKRSMNSHDVITFVHNKFNVSTSPGAVYSYVYFLERNGLIKVDRTKTRRVYTLTEKGEENARAFLTSRDKILGLVLNLFIGV